MTNDELEQRLIRIERTVVMGLLLLADELDAHLHGDNMTKFGSEEVKDLKRVLGGEIMSIRNDLMKEK